MILAGQCKRSFTCLKQVPVERSLCGQFLGCRIGMIESLILFIFFGLSGSTPEQSHHGVLILSQVSLMFSILLYSTLLVLLREWSPNIINIYWTSFNIPYTIKIVDWAK